MTQAVGKRLGGTELAGIHLPSYVEHVHPLQGLPYRGYTIARGLTPTVIAVPACLLLLGPSGPRNIPYIGKSLWEGGLNISKMRKPGRASTTITTGG